MKSHSIILQIRLFRDFVISGETFPLPINYSPYLIIPPFVCVWVFFLTVYHLCTAHPLKQFLRLSINVLHSSSTPYTLSSLTYSHFFLIIIVLFFYFLLYLVLLDLFQSVMYNCLFPLDAHLFHLVSYSYCCSLYTFSFPFHSLSSKLVH